MCGRDGVQSSNFNIEQLHDIFIILYYLFLRYILRILKF